MRDRNVNVTATPPLFGYNETESAEIWPEYEYPECQPKETQIGRRIYIDYQTNKLHLDCEEGEEG